MTQNLFIIIILLCLCPVVFALTDYLTNILFWYIRKKELLFFFSSLPELIISLNKTVPLFAIQPIINLYGCQFLKVNMSTFEFWQKKFYKIKFGIN